MAVPMLTETELREIEASAVELARNAGKLLLGYFSGPLQVSYKSANHRNPVTDADQASDEYLRTEIARRFPDHGLVSEESDEGADRPADVTWVIDPLDGTTNFVHGLPTFAVLIGVLERGRPVVSATFLPSVTSPHGHVLHAHAGGGAYDEDVRLSLAEDAEPVRRMSAWPSYFLRMFKFKPHLSGRLGDVRATGSSGFELAMAARGAFDYATLNNQWIWDAASGVLLVQEAGGRVFTYERSAKRWRPFETFVVERAGDAATPGELRTWRQSLVVGTASATEFITSGLGFQPYRLRRLRRRLSGWLRKPAAAAPTPTPAQSQGQGKSLRE